METPKYYEFMNPTFQALREGGGTLTNEEIVNAVVTLIRLPDAVLERTQHGHNLSEVEYRIAWAKSYLKQAGYLTQSERGVWALTAQGKDAPRINEREIVTDIRKAYVAQRKAKSLSPAPQGAPEEAVQETAAAEEIEEELSWKQQVLRSYVAPAIGRGSPLALGALDARGQNLRIL
jgi:restriction system protein